MNRSSNTTIIPNSPFQKARSKISLIVMTTVATNVGRRSRSTDRHARIISNTAVIPNSYIPIDRGASQQSNTAVVPYY
eukprot:CCRYP_018264-RA/>CCRYP_018264-RA protein AED:0.01 eAED:0.01 QI:0/1/0.5/1/0/0/2/177/77